MDLQAMMESFAEAWVAANAANPSSAGIDGTSNAPSIDNVSLFQ